jgi:hypothetical protein
VLDKFGWDKVLCYLGRQLAPWYRPQIIDGWNGGFWVMRIGRGKWSTQRKFSPPWFCPPQIPHEPTWGWIHSPAVRNRLRSARIMARPRAHAHTRARYNNTVTRRTASRQRLGKHVPAATNTHATIEVLLETVFSTRSVQRGYKEYSWSKTRHARVEADSNTSTVALRVVGGDEKGTQYLGV